MIVQQLTGGYRLARFIHECCLSTVNWSALAAKCRDEHPLVISLNLNIALFAVGLLGTLAGLMSDAGQETSQLAAYLSGPWSVMGPGEWLAIFIMSVSFIVGSVGAALAYQLGHPMTIATLDFTYIAFAFLWGLVFFRELPNGMAFFGILVIICAGVFIVRHNRCQTRFRVS